MVDTKSSSYQSPHASQQSLVATTDKHDGGAIFDLSEDGSVPGNLHLTDDAAILRYINRHGAVSVVRQLATDLAEREAEVGLLRKQKDDRERELKKLLVQFGISLSEIDRRLNAVSIRDPSEAIDQLVGEALEMGLMDRENEEKEEEEEADTSASSVAQVAGSVDGVFVASNGASNAASDAASEVSIVSKGQLEEDESKLSNLHETNGSGPSLPGPLELRDIVPQSAQPPTMTKQTQSNSTTKQITDRYGFIQPSNVRKKDANHSSCDAEEGHMNYNPLHTLNNGSHGSVHGSGQMLQDLAKATMAQATALTNRLTQTTTSSAKSGKAKNADSKDVRALLRELGHQHDEVQKIQDTKWGEFMRKLEDSVDPLSSQPVIGVVGTNLKGKTAREFKELIYTGIPVDYRPKIWGECSGAWSSKEPGTYDWLLAKEVDQSVDQLDQQSSLKQIELDLHRTMPSNVYFGGTGAGVEKLRRVLVAYSRWNTGIGYCQGMNMIAAMLLLSFATEEDAFWVLVSLIENILPSGYFAAPLLVVREDLKIFQLLLTQNMPALMRHLDDIQVQLDAITFDWFLSCFTDTLPPDVVFRLWDILLCVEGQSYMFKIALALFQMNEAELMAINSTSGVYSHMKNLNSNNQNIKVDNLIKAASLFNIPNNLDEVRERRLQALKEA